MVPLLFTHLGFICFDIISDKHEVQYLNQLAMREVTHVLHKETPPSFQCVNIKDV